jgi:response regulator NasT
MTATESHPTTEPVISPDKLPEEPTTILVADDEHLVASGIAGHLTELGYHVIGPASDGEEAIKLCRAVRPDLALLDIRMPVRDGIEAAEEIFSQLGIPVIILSAYSDPDYVEGARSGGVFGYLLKPVTQDQLRVAISVAWARYLGFMEQSDQIHTLKERLEHRKTIEQAKWVIVKRKGVDEPGAMRLLQRQARNNRRSLIEVARSVLENVDLFGDDESEA